MVNGKPVYTKLSGDAAEGTYAALNDMASRGKFISNKALADFEKSVNSVLSKSSNPFDRKIRLNQLRSLYPDLFKQLDTISFGTKGFTRALKSAPVEALGKGIKRAVRAGKSIARW